MPGAQTDPRIAAQAMAMGDAGYPPAVVAAALGKPRSTISEIISRHGRWGEIAQKPVFEQWRRDQQQILETSYRQSAAELLAHAMEPAKLDKGSTYQLVIASKIALEASRLLAGESTANVDIHCAIPALDNLASILSQSLLNPVDIKPDK